MSGMYWKSDIGEQTRLIHVDETGLAFVFGDAKTIGAIAEKLDAGEEPDHAISPYVRKPWSGFQSFERYDGNVSFDWDLGVLGKTAKVPFTPSDAEALWSQIEAMAGMRRSERAMSALEIAKGPAMGAGAALLASGALLYLQGMEMPRGGRNAGRARIIGFVTETLGTAGIVAIGVLGLVVAAAMIAMRLKNTPVVLRLER